MLRELVEREHVREARPGDRRLWPEDVHPSRRRQGHDHGREEGSQPADGDHGYPSPAGR